MLVQDLLYVIIQYSRKVASCKSAILFSKWIIILFFHVHFVSAESAYNWGEYGSCRIAVIFVVVMLFHGVVELYNVGLNILCSKHGIVLFVPSHS